MDSGHWYWDALEGTTDRRVLRIERAIAAGANPNGITSDDSTPLGWAAFNEHLAVVECLLRGGAIPDAETHGDSTSLHAAAERDHPAILRALLDAPHGKVIDRFDYIDRTPLIIAAERDELESARLLIDAGASVNANNEANIGETALSRAAENASVAMVDLLLKAGADPTISGWMQLTPIHRAQRREQPLRGQMLALMRTATGLTGDAWEARLLPHPWPR